MAVSQALAARVVTVDTADNSDPAGNGKTSLLEALNGLQDGDVIQFNLPGAGPFRIQTPLGGYPLITVNNVIIDGYSQPGATANSHGILEGNNANIQIYLDSTSAELTGDPTLPTGHSTRLTDYSGYGDSENAILGLVAASHVRIKGLGFLSHQTSGETENPSIYCVALVNGSEDCRIQGCRFGLDPDGHTIHGSSAAVAAFRYNGDTGYVYSSGLVFGTDGDGTDDVKEFNITTGMHIALAIELPHARISGNYFNVLPDGKTFVNVSDIHQSLTDAGRSGGDASVENMENGRETEGTIIGTDGDGVSDANERNIFNTVVYDHLIEFYSGTASEVVVAGNYFGVGVDGTSLPLSPTNAAPDLISLPSSGSLRLGSDFNGVSDALEGNLIVGLAGTQLVDAGSSFTLLARGNRIVNCGFAAFPFADGSNGRNYADYYAAALLTPTAPTPTITAFAGGVLSGTLPAVATDTYPLSEVDVYLTAPVTGTNTNNLPGTYLKSFRDNGATDTDAALNQFSVDLSSVSVPPGSKLVIAANYSADASGFGFAGTPLTGPLSAAFTVPGSTAITFTPPTVGASGLVLSWTGGTGPFLVQGKLGLTDAWIDLVTTSQRTVTIPLAGFSGFFRVVDGTSKTVKLFHAKLSGANERPTPVTTAGTGTGLLALDGLTATYVVSYQNLSSAPSAYHLHGLGTAEQAVGVKFGLMPSGALSAAGGLFVGQNAVDQATADGIADGQTYFNIHTAANGGGEIRGQVLP
jgi:hypothetical protein